MTNTPDKYWTWSMALPRFLNWGGWEWHSDRNHITAIHWCHWSISEKIICKWILNEWIHRCSGHSRKYVNKMSTYQFGTAKNGFFSCTRWHDWLTKYWGRNQRRCIGGTKWQDWRKLMHKTEMHETSALQKMMAKFDDWCCSLLHLPEWMGDMFTTLSRDDRAEMPET